MGSEISRYFPFIFPFFFIGRWLFVTTILAVMSGWFDLAHRYPDRDEVPLLTLRFQSGSMGIVSMSRILLLEPCPSGLRIGIWRIFGPFSKNLFIPWSDIRVSRGNGLLWKVAKLNLVGGQSFTVMDYIADRIARAVPALWPEKGVFHKEAASQSAWGVLKLWFAGTVLASAFFILAPRLMAPAGAANPPVAVAVAFPAIVFGIAAIVQFIRRRSDQ